MVRPQRRPTPLNRQHHVRILPPRPTQPQQCRPNGNVRHGREMGQLAGPGR
jgi:hypothetical protein